MMKETFYFPEGSGQIWHTRAEHYISGVQTSYEGYEYVGFKECLNGVNIKSVSIGDEGDAGFYFTELEDFFRAKFEAQGGLPPDKAQALQAELEAVKNVKPLCMKSFLDVEADIGSLLCTYQRFDSDKPYKGIMEPCEFNGEDCFNPGFLGPYGVDDCREVEWFYPCHKNGLIDYEVWQAARDFGVEEYQEKEGAQQDDRP